MSSSRSSSTSTRSRSGSGSWSSSICILHFVSIVHLERVVIIAIVDDILS